MIKTFEEVLTIKNGKNQKSVENPEGEYPIYGSGGIMGYADKYLCEANAVIIGRKGSINNPIYVETPFWNVDTAFGLVAKPKVLNPKYLYYFCVYFDFTRLNTTVTIPSLTKANLNKIKIKVPELVRQKKEAEVLDNITKIIESRKNQLNQLDNLIKSRFVEMFGEPISNPKGWEKNRLGSECNIVTGNTPSRNVDEYYGDYIEWIKSDNISSSSEHLSTAKEYLSEEGLKVGRSVEAGSILMTCIAGSIKSIANVAIADRKVSFNQQINAVVPKQHNTWFMYVQFMLSQEYIRSTINMSLKGILSKGTMSDLEFVFPPSELQEDFALFAQQTYKLKVEVQKSLEETQLLFDSLMQKYFD